MTVDYKNTVFLPKTDFPMRAGLPQKEPELLAFWDSIKLYDTLRRESQGRPKYVLHDGPPYANGNIHIGHAVNKVLKDVVSRSFQMLGYDSEYVPGWDCHGLPIEWKIEEKYREKKISKDGVPILQFRKECRDFAQHWKDVQASEFQRLGVMGDWAHPYMTMTFAAEAQIAREIHAFALNGGLFRDVKPVMWSVVEKTALAEAEVEYHDHTSQTVYVKFPIIKSAVAELKGASIVIWTTTPWTLPANRAIAYGKDVSYSFIETQRYGRLLVATDLLDNFVKASGLQPDEWQEYASNKVTGLRGESLEGTVCAHPLRGQGYEFDVPLLEGSFVTTEAGTGFVHIAPNHGEDDYHLGRANRVRIYGEEGGLTQSDFVDDEGRYRPSTPLFAGKIIYKPNGKPGDANDAVIEALKKVDTVLAQKQITHSYPHSWRSKAPLIFRTTPQWFISMERNDLRKTALRAINDEVTWFPAQGQNRIRAMIETRPDWCISRQRAWGVPIAIFVSRNDGRILCDKDVFARIAAAFDKDGADAWYARDPQEFLGDAYKAADYEQVRDIVDVWFESGSTHAFVLEARKSLHSPADLYLEGSDQHRGWFHSSLLESCGTRGRAPYKNVLTHGFVLDEQGRKMSKSMGNVVAPQEVTEKMGADILRLWIIGSDYTEDLRVGQDILKQYSEYYRRLRNTLRYLLGALDGFSETEWVAQAKDMPELERWVLHRLHEVDKAVRAGIAQYSFNSVLSELHHFCAVDLSAFYFDIRKDSLYCDAPSSPKRRAARTVMAHVFENLVRWLAPILCFTAEEAWQLWPRKESKASVHQTLFYETPAAWRDDALAEKIKALRDVRGAVTVALEQQRNAKTIGSSLQARPVVVIEEAMQKYFEGVDFAEMCITSDIEIKKASAAASAPSVDVTLATGHKCERCWRVLVDVGQHAVHKTVCLRCADAVDAQMKAA